MDDRRHKTQHAARALEFVQSRPVVVQAVEKFRVDGVGLADAPFVVGLAAFGGELVVLRPIHAHIGAGHSVPRRKGLRGGHGFKEPAAHDFKAFVRAGRSPA